MSSVVAIKTILSEGANQVLQTLPTNFAYVVVEDSEGQDGRPACMTVRSSISSAQECQRWLDDYQQMTLTRWIIARCVNRPTRFVFRRQWFCQHSSLNKGRSKEKSKSTNCRAKLDIKIKKQTCDTRKKDEFLKLKPPLPAIIKLFYTHNHGTEFVQKREIFLADFSQSQFELKEELIRLSQLISTSKPANSAMKQLTFALKQIKTEAELFEAMRKVRLKPNVFTRVGRPSKKGPLLDLKTREKEQKKLKKPTQEVTLMAATSAATSTSTVYEIVPIVTELQDNSHTIITLPDDVVIDTTHHTAMDISFLFA